MKKAPKRYAIGGVVYDDPKKKKPFTSSVPTVNQQMAQKGNINPTTADLLDRQNVTMNLRDDNLGKANLGLQGAGTGINSGRTFVTSDANGNTTYKDNATGATYTVDKTGNKIGYAIGGTIYIDKSHEGMFTDWAKNHGMSVQEAASHVMANKDKYEPHVVQMANFAKNFGGGKAKGGVIMKKAPSRYNKGGMC